MRKTLTLALFLVLSVYSYSQTLVNREWVQQSGEPNTTYSNQTSHFDASGNLIVIGNTLHNGQLENMYISKFDQSGNPMWQQEFNGTWNGADFATDIATIGDQIYVTGVQADTPYGNNATLITTLSLDPNGNIQYVQTYPVAGYHGHNIAARIIVDPNNNLYVTGSIQVSLTEYDLVAIMYDQSLSQRWDYKYGVPNLYTGGVSLVYTDGLTIYGISGPAPREGDFITIYINPSGIQSGFEDMPSPAGYISNPTAFGVDGMHNIYETGTYGTSTNTDIAVAKLDSPLNIVWTVTLDGGSNLNDGVNDMKVDATGNTYITGYATDAGGTKQAWTLMLDAVGHKVWDRKRSNAEGKSIAFDASGNVYVTGTAGSNQITIAYDNSGNVLWEKVYSSGAGATDQGCSITLDGTGNVYVYGQSTNGGMSTYSTLKYNQTKLPNTIVTDAVDGSEYIDNEILVRFNPAILNMNFIGNRDLLYGIIDSIIPDSIIVKIATQTSIDLHGAKLSKIITELTLADTITITRGGDTMAIPKFWSSLLLTNFNTDELNTKNIRNRLDYAQPEIYYTALNHVGIFDLCDNSDPNFNSMTALFDASHNDDINWCPAYSTGVVGSSSIKIGVYDSGVNSQHEDLKYNGATKILGGKDYTVGTPVNILNTPNSDVYGHGTAMMGIIGAQSGNGKGVAGVAGGDATHSGCALYANKIGSTAPTITTTTLYNAIVSDASSTGFGLNVANHSYHFGIADNFMHDAFRFSARNGVVSPCSTGDDGMQLNYYPSGFTNLGFTIKVGASDSTGDWASVFSTGSGGSNWGYGVDLIAPGLNYQYKILSYTSNTGYTNSIFGGTAIADGTSPSTAFVSGAAGLVLSTGKALSMPSGTVVSLAPEDVKNILKIKASTYNLPNYDPTYAGSGRLNIGHALDSIAYPKYKIRHYSGIPPYDASTVITSNQLINLTWDYETDPADTLTRLVKFGIYTADIYKFSLDIPYTLGATESIVGGWTLPNQSEYWGPKHVSLITTYDVDPDPLPSGFINTGAHKIQMAGYVYHIKRNHAGDSLDIWVPFRADSLLQHPHKMAYAMWTVDPNATGLEEVRTATLEAKIYPSPTYSQLNIEYYLSDLSDIRIRIIDINGRILIEENSKDESGLHSHQMNLGNLASGMYLCEVNGKDGKYIGKFIKE